MTTREIDPASDADGADEAEAPPRRFRRERVEREPDTVGRKIGGLARELVIVVVGALIVSSLIRAFLGQMFVIPSGSMENTLMINDRVVSQKFTGFDGVLFTRGQAVVFADPGQWLPASTVERGPIRQGLEFVGVLPNSSTGYLIKRVIGMPGDTVECCDDQGRLLVNGQPLDETSYLYTDANGTQVAPSEIDFTVVVPAGRIFVMGDHRNESADSRCHLADVVGGEPDGMNAFVPVDNVVGPAIAIVSPLSRFESLRTPATFADVPAPAQSAPAAPTIEPAGVHC